MGGVGQPRSRDSDCAADASRPHIHSRAGNTETRADAALAEIEAHAWEELKRLPEPKPHAPPFSTAVNPILARVGLKGDTYFFAKKYVSLFSPPRPGSSSSLTPTISAERLRIPNRSCSRPIWKRQAASTSASSGSKSQIVTEWTPAPHVAEAQLDHSLFTWSQDNLAVTRKNLTALGSK